MKSPINNEHGFTIVEALVVMVVSTLLMTMVFNFHILQNKSCAVQEQISFAQKNVRGAMKTMETDIRMAGSGFPKSALASSIRIIEGTGQCQDGTSSPDEIIVLHDIPGIHSVLADSMDHSGDVLICDDVSGFSEGWALIEDGIGAETFCVTRVDRQSGALAHDTKPLSRAYCSGSRIKQIEYGQYGIDSRDDPDHPRLVKRDWKGAQHIIAENIENVQFSYVLDDHSETTLQPSKAEKIVWVRVDIVGRTRSADQDYGDDGYRRRDLSTRVQLRNFHLRRGI